MNIKRGDLKRIVTAANAIINRKTPLSVLLYVKLTFTSDSLVIDSFDGESYLQAKAPVDGMTPEFEGASVYVDAKDLTLAVNRMFLEYVDISVDSEALWLSQEGDCNSRVSLWAYNKASHLDAPSVAEKQRFDSSKLSIPYKVLHPALKTSMKFCGDMFKGFGVFSKYLISTNGQRLSFMPLASEDLGVDLSASVKFWNVLGIVMTKGTSVQFGSVDAGNPAPATPKQGLPGVANVNMVAVGSDGSGCEFYLTSPTNTAVPKGALDFMAKPISKLIKVPRTSLKGALRFIVPLAVDGEVVVKTSDMGLILKTTKGCRFRAQTCVPFDGDLDAMCCGIRPYQLDICVSGSTGDTVSFGLVVEGSFRMVYFKDGESLFIFTTLKGDHYE